MLLRGAHMQIVQGNLMQLADFHHIKADNSIFIRHLSSGIIVLAVYIDDIILTDRDIKGICDTKTHRRLNLI